MGVCSSRFSSSVSPHPASVVPTAEPTFQAPESQAAQPQQRRRSLSDRKSHTRQDSSILLPLSSPAAVSSVVRFPASPTGGPVEHGSFKDRFNSPSTARSIGANSASLSTPSSAPSASASAVSPSSPAFPAVTLPPSSPAPAAAAAPAPAPAQSETPGQDSTPAAKSLPSLAIPDDDDMDDDSSSSSSSVSSGPSTVEELPEIAEEAEEELVDDGFEASLMRARATSRATHSTTNTSSLGHPAALSKNARNSLVERNSSLGKLLESFSPANAHILVVDEDEAAQEIVAKWLASKRYHVTLANDGEEAVEVLEEAGRDCDRVNDIDLVLSDSLMVTPQGKPLLDWVVNNEKTAHIPVVLMSSEISIQATDRSIRRGASDFLKKPLQRTVLLKTIRTILESIVEQRNTQKLKEFGDTFKEQLMALNLNPSQLGLGGGSGSAFNTPSPSAANRAEAHTLGLPSSPRHKHHLSIGTTISGLAPNLLTSSEFQFELLLIAQDPALAEFSECLSTGGFKLHAAKNVEEALDLLGSKFNQRLAAGLTTPLSSSFTSPGLAPRDLLIRAQTVPDSSHPSDSAPPNPALSPSIAITPPQNALSGFDSPSDSPLLSPQTIAERRNLLKPTLNLTVISTSGATSPMVLSPSGTTRSLSSTDRYTPLVDLVCIDLDSLEGSDSDLPTVSNQVISRFSEFTTSRSTPPLSIVVFYSKPVSEMKSAAILAVLTDFLKQNRIDSAILKPIGRDTLRHKLKILLNNLLVKRKAAAFAERATLYKKILTNNRANRSGRNSIVSHSGLPNGQRDHYPGSATNSPPLSASIPPITPSGSLALSTPGTGNPEFAQSYAAAFQLSAPLPQQPSGGSANSRNSISSNSTSSSFDSSSDHRIRLPPVIGKTAKSNSGNLTAPMSLPPIGMTGKRRPSSRAAQGKHSADGLDDAKSEEDAEEKTEVIEL